MQMLLVAVAALCAAGPAYTAPLADHVPEEALVYIGWHGADEAAAGFEQTHFKQLLDETQLRELVGYTLPLLAERYGHNDPTDGMAQRVLDELGSVAWRRPWTFYLAGVAEGMMGPGGPPMPRAGLIIAPGDDRDAINEHLAMLQAMGLPMQIAEADDMIHLTFADAPPAEGAPRLAESESFTQAMQQLPGEAVAVGYVNVDGLLALVRSQAQLHASPDEQEELATFIDVLGLDGVHTASFAAGFDGPRWLTQAFVDAPAPRRGLAQWLLDGEPITDRHLAVAPVTTTWLATMRLDLAGMVDQARTATDRLDPASAGEIDEAMFMASMMTGVDLEADLLQGLGRVWVMYRDANVAGPTSWLGMAVANELREPERVAAALRSLGQAARDAAEPDHESEPHLRFVTFEHAGVEVHSFTVPIIQPTWAIHDGTLHAGLLPQSVMAAIDFAQAGGPSILDNERFQAVRGWLGAPPASAVTFTDLEATAPHTYGSTMMIGQLASSIAIAMSPADDGRAMALLPSLGKLMAHLGPAGQVAWADDAGWHSQSVSPFPGSQMLGYEGMFGPSALAMSASTLLPALGAARSATQQTQSLSNVRQLSVAVHAYAIDHGDQLPDELADLYGTYLPEASLFFAPGVPVAAPVEMPGSPEDQQVDWIRRNSSYIFLGGELPDRLEALPRPSETVMLVERPEHAADQRIAVGFADGHAQSMPLHEARRLVLEQTGKTLEELLERQQTYTDE
ncbi:MAG: hypothetical protein WDZ31_08290 [Phycisphaeraceae bacterium]